ncbi:MAG: hypothetical protein R2764_15045 [Bacteroidales bacterium]
MVSLWFQGRDPYDSLGWVEHTYGDCTGDYVVNQWINTVDSINEDASTKFEIYGDGSKTYYTSTSDEDGMKGLKTFFESRGYNVLDAYTQLTDNTLANYFAFDDFKNEINSGRPVLIHVTGHTMLGYGYDDNSNLIYLHDTWDYNQHSMTWNGQYPYEESQGNIIYLQHIAVSVIELEPSANTIWTGALNTDWFNVSNWTNGVPTSVMDAIIPFVTNLPIISSNGAVTNNLLVEPNAKIEIHPSGNLTTLGLYTNNGQLILNSDATGAAGSFIDNGGLDGIGTFQFNRYLNSAPSGNSGWHYISSPVNNSVSGDFVGYWLKEWQPNGNTYFDIDPFGPNPCDPCDWSRLNDPISVMQGYSVKQDLSYPSYCPG